MTLNFPGGPVEVSEPAPQTTRLASTTRYHLEGVRTALTLAISGEVRSDVALPHALAQLDALALLLASGKCYAVEAVSEPERPGDLVVLDAIDGLLDDTEPMLSGARDNRENAA